MSKFDRLNIILVGDVAVGKSTLLLNTKGLVHTVAPRPITEPYYKGDLELGYPYPLTGGLTDGTLLSDKSSDSEDEMKGDLYSQNGVDFRQIEVIDERGNGTQGGKSTAMIHLWDIPGGEISSPYCETSVGAIVVFDVTSRASFERLPLYLRKGDDPPNIVIVANRISRRDMTVVKGPSHVTNVEGMHLASQRGLLYTETSGYFPGLETALKLLVQRINAKIDSGLLDPRCMHISDSLSCVTIPEQEAMITGKNVRRRNNDEVEEGDNCCCRMI